MCLALIVGPLSIGWAAKPLRLGLVSARGSTGTDGTFRVRFFQLPE